MNKGDLSKTEIKALLKEHGTIVGAAAACDVSRLTFTRWMKAYKIKTPERGRPSNLPARGKLVKALNKGTRESVARDFEVSVPGLQKWLDKHGIRKIWA